MIEISIFFHIDHLYLIISWSEKMKNKTLRNDLIVIVILFLIIGGLFFFKSRKQGQLIEITKDNQIYGYYSLNEDQIIKIDQENTIQIKNQKSKNDTSYLSRSFMY